MNVVKIGARSFQLILLATIAFLCVPSYAGTLAPAAAMQDEDNADGGNPESSDGAEAVLGAAPQDEPLNVSIDAGACTTPDDNTPAFALPGAAFVGTSAGGDTYASETEVPAALSDLLARPHVIAIRLVDVEFSVPIACAPLEGEVVGGKLVIGLLGADSNALTGIAVLSEASGGTATQVETYAILPAATGSDDDGRTEDDQEDTVDGEGGV